MRVDEEEREKEVNSEEKSTHTYIHKIIHTARSTHINISSCSTPSKEQERRRRRRRERKQDVDYIYRRTTGFSEVNSPTRTYTSLPMPYIVSIVSEPFRYSQYARDVGTPNPYLEQFVSRVLKTRLRLRTRSSDWCCLL